MRFRRSECRRSGAVWLGTLAVVATAVVGGAIAQSSESATKADVLPGSAPNRDVTSDPRLDVDVSARRTTGAEASSTFDLASTERLRVRAWGYTELTGEYMVDTASNTISVPGVGRVRIAGMTPVALEEYLSRFLSKSLRREVGVSIEVGRFRPFFITGQVSEPSAMEWQPNLTVIKAVALARGVRREGVEGASTSPHQARINLMFALSQLARLEAELEFLGGSTALRGNIPAAATLASMLDIVSPATKATVRSFMERQEAYLEEQRALVQGQIAALETERATVQQELAAAKGQERAIKDQVAITRELVGNLEALRQNNIVSNPSYLERRHALINNQVRHLESQSALERARARVEAIGRQISAVTQERRSVVYDRIATLEREIAQLSVRSDENVAGPELEFQIVRKTKTTEVISARLDTEVLPGDVVIVSNADRRGGRAGTVAELRNMSEADVFETVQRTIEASAATRGRSEARQSDTPRSN